MKKIALLLAGWCIAAAAAAQEINFEHGDLASVTAKAKASGKLIFIDVYTSWCGPCKKMAQTVFKQPAVGSYYNGQFINYKIDAEKGAGIALAKKYSVQFYPTYLFIDGDGNLYGKAIGYKVDSLFLLTGKIAQGEFTNPNSLNHLQAFYESRKNDTAYLQVYIDKQIGNELPATQSIEQYLSVQTAMAETSPQMMAFLTKYWKQLSFGGLADQLLTLNLVTYRSMADSQQLALLNDGGLFRRVRSLRYAIEQHSEKVLKAYMHHWEQLAEEQQGAQIRESIWLDYYAGTGQWDAYRQLGEPLLDSLSNAFADLPRAAVKMEYRKMQDFTVQSGVTENTGKTSASPTGARPAARRVTVQFLMPGNNPEDNRKRRLAYLLYTHAKTWHQQFDPAEKVSPKALYWMERALAMNPDHYRIQNTYANFLYLHGDVEKAIRWKKSALKPLQADSPYRPPIEKNLAHIQKGEPLEEE